MNTNIPAQSLGNHAIPTPAGAAGAAREARLDQVTTSLEQQSLQVQSLNANELAQYRTYSAEVGSDIDTVQGYGASATGGAADPMVMIDMILQQHQQMQSFLMMSMMIQYLLMMMQQMMEMMGAGAGGQQQPGTGGGGGVRPDGPSRPERPDEPNRPERPEGPTAPDEAGEADGKHEEMTPVRAARILAKYFDLLDTAAGKGKKDNVVEMADLEAVAQNPDLPEELRRAADYVVKNPAVAHALDVGNKVDEVDGRFGIKDFERFIEEHEGKEGYDKPIEEAKPRAPEGRPSEEDRGRTEEPSEEAPVEAPDGGSEAGPAEEVERPNAGDPLAAQQDAIALYEAMRGWGHTDEERLISILSNRSNQQIALIKDCYIKSYDRDLVEHVHAETSGRFRTTLMALLQGNRDESTQIDEHLVRDDVQAIYEATGTFSNDDEKHIAIFTSRSKAHLAQVAQVFEHIHGEPLRQFIERNVSNGDYKTTLLAQLPEA